MSEEKIVGRYRWK